MHPVIPKSDTKLRSMRHACAASHPGWNPKSTQLYHYTSNEKNISTFHCRGIAVPCDQPRPPLPRQLTTAFSTTPNVDLTQGNAKTGFVGTVGGIFSHHLQLLPASELGLGGMPIRREPGLVDSHLVTLWDNSTQGIICLGNRPRRNNGTVDRRLSVGPIAFDGAAQTTAAIT